MSAIPASVAPLSAPSIVVPTQTLAELQRLADSLDAAKLWWVSGYFAGLAQSSATVATGSQLTKLPAAAVDSRVITILYGSQTGNAKRIAERLSGQLSAQQIPQRLLSTADYPTRELANERYLVVVVSTHGDGDPPDDARSFLEFINSRRAPTLAQLHYSVLALGDSSYPQFCAVGKQLDARLQSLGAKAWLPMQEADVDLERVAAPWQQQLLRQAQDQHQRPTLSIVANTSNKSDSPKPEAKTEGFSRTQPFQAEVLTNQKITSRESARHIHHLELALTDHASLHYQPGDALGVWADNDQTQIDQVLQHTKLTANAPVVIDDQTVELGLALRQHRELGKLPRGFLALHAKRSQISLPTDGFPKLLDLLSYAPAAWDAQALVDNLRPMQPRLYSIASSMLEVGNEAHLCVAQVQYQQEGIARFGLASEFLRQQSIGNKLRVFVERNERFRLPSDGSRDIIMIGPGTGVAPYRGFLQERVAAGSKGRNWLVFGAAHARHDFLYQLEWQRAQRSGHLHHVDLAFSRDQAQKIYVQDLLRKNGKQVFHWLENGAHLYVCGDASQMAKDVEATLLEIIGKHVGTAASIDAQEQALAYLQQLRQQHRYAKDVY